MLAPNTAVIAETSRYDPEPFRKRVVDGGAEVFAEGLVEALKPSVPCGLCKRPRYAVWAYRTFAKVARLTATEPQVLIAILQQYGVKDEQEMQTLVESGRRMAQVQQSVTADPGAFLEDGLALVEAVLRLEPGRLPEVLRRLGQVSGAQEVNGNGVAQ